MEKFRQRIKENRIIVDIVCIFLVTLILSVPMFNKNTDIYLDDGSQHLMRAFGTYQSIKQNGTANVISNFTNGFGYSWNLFYGPGSSHLIIFLSMIFGSFNFGFKLAFFIIMFFAGICMYKFVKELTDNKNTGLLAGIIYITSPYFFTDIYVRHASGEALAFVFIPMVFLGLYNLFNTEKNHYYLIFGVVGLILSHNISTVLTAVFALIYCLVNIKNIISTRVKKGLIIDIAFILLISSFYWMPFLETKFFTDYRVYEPNAMSNEESFLSHTLNLKKMFITPNNEIFVFEIGLPVILMLVFSIMTFRRIKENKKEYLFFLIAGILSSLMATKYFPWKWVPSSFFIIQFPWRMLVFSSFFFAVVCSINMTTVIKNFNAKDVLIISVICIIYVLSRYGVVQYNENMVKVEDYQIINVSGQDNEWLPGMGRLEYLPSKAYKNTFYIATREPGILALEGEIELTENIKIGTYISAKISTKEEGAKLELPYVYYPGYTVRFDGIIMETFETENGFLGCNIPANEKGKIEVKYTGTNLMNISKIISIITSIIFIIYVWKKR